MATTHKVLLIEDDEDLRQCLRELLSEHYLVFTANDGVEGVAVAKQHHPTVILLDLMMPRSDGFETLKFLREDPETRATPVLILTALSDLNVRLRTFNLGADDFMSKPMNTEELLARIASKIRLLESLTPKKRTDALIQCGNLSMNPRSLEVRIGDDVVPLSLLEFNLVRYFVKHKDKLRTRRQILEAVWSNREISERILDPHILLIRRKLKGFDHQIATVYGGGYILKSPRHLVEGAGATGSDVGSVAPELE